MAPRTEAARGRAPPDWADVQFFVAVAEAGGVGAAAERLRVNHSTVLRRLARLERRLGARLFDRLPGGYAPTAAGNALAAHLAGVSEQVEAARRHLAGLDPAIEGPIRVTSSDVVVEGLLMPLLANFRTLHRGVRIELVMGYGYADLAPREADVAVRGADALPPQLVGRRVGRLQTVLCASGRYLARVPRGTPLHAHRWVIADESLGFAHFEAWFTPRVPPERVAMRIDSLVGLADAVVAGVGVGMLPLPLVRVRSDLVPLADPEPALDKPIWVLMHPDVQRTPRVRALYRHLVTALGADANLAHDGPDADDAQGGAAAADPG